MEERDKEKMGVEKGAWLYYGLHSGDDATFELWEDGLLV